MKLPVIISTLTALLNPALAAARVPELSCANHMYREAELAMNPQGQVLLQDSYVGPLDALVKHLAKKHHLPLAHRVSSVRLSVKADDMDCRTLGRYPMDCQTRAGAQGHLLLSLFFGENEMTGSMTLNLPVNVRAFTIKSVLSSPGRVSLGSQAVTVDLKTLVIDAKADLDYEGVSIPATWSTFFHTDAPEGNSGSWCY